MKRRATRCVMSLLVLCLLLSACGGSSSNTAESSTQTTVVDNRSTSSNSAASVVDNRKQTTETTEETPAASFSEDDFESTGYLYQGLGGSSMYYIVVKNNGQATVEVTANGQAKDAGGNILGADSDTMDVLGPGEESIMYFYFSNVTGVDHVDYELSYSAETYYKPVLSNIAVSQTINDQNLTVTATNNGDINAQFVQAYALFLDADGNVVRADNTYITDNDSEIKPGATLSAQLNCREAFDSVICYLTGRSDGTASEATSDVSEDDFDVREHYYEMSNNTQYFLIVKNNSDKVVGIKFNGTGYDANGNVIAADDCDIDVLGVGEESIAYFYFQGVTGIDHVEYQMQFDTAPYYNPVIGDLSVVQNMNDSNVVLVVTNEGEKPAQFVQAYALFFDASGNLIREASAYVTDNDSEIKPGATLSAQLDCRNGYDTVECYFTGRASK